MTLFLDWFDLWEDIEKGMHTEETTEEEQEIEVIKDKEQEIGKTILNKTPLKSQMRLTEKEIKEIILSKVSPDQVYLTDEDIRRIVSIYTSDPQHDSSHTSWEDGTREKAALKHAQLIVSENKRKQTW